jgi:thymidylate synthase ThyX
MTIEAKILADSVNENGNRLRAFELIYPKFCHNELLTHRMLSRNASSSRAIPVTRMINDIIADTAMPIHWGKNQKGMQAREECDNPVRLHLASDDLMHDVSREDAWFAARNKAIYMARIFSDAGYHKQIVNRLLEPFMHIRVVLSATELSNFYALRRHEDAQPEIKMLADKMFEAEQASTPKLLKPGEWHLPYVSDEERAAFSNLDCIKMSVARCARVSYLTHDGMKPNIEQDFALFERLVGVTPPHASPSEHQATPDSFVRQPSRVFSEEPAPVRWSNPKLHGNFVGFIQFRKTLQGECQ